MVLGVPRAWITWYGFFPIIAAYQSSDFIGGLLIGTLLFAVLHLPAVFLAKIDPYAYEIFRRGFNRRRIYQV